MDKNVNFIPIGQYNFLCHGDEFRCFLFSALLQKNAVLSFCFFCCIAVRHTYGTVFFHHKNKMIVKGKAESFVLYWLKSHQVREGTFNQNG